MTICPAGLEDRLTVVGEIDMVASADLRTRGMAAVDNAEAVLLVDLSQVTFLDASGLGVLVDMRQRALDQHTKFRLIGTPPMVARLFALTRLDALLSS